MAPILVCVGRAGISRPVGRHVVVGPNTQTKQLIEILHSDGVRHPRGDLEEHNNHRLGLSVHSGDISVVFLCINQVAKQEIGING